MVPGFPMAPQEPWLWRDLTPLHLSLVAKNYATADVLIEAELFLRWGRISGGEKDEVMIGGWRTIKVNALVNARVIWCWLREVGDG